MKAIFFFQYWISKLLEHGYIFFCFQNFDFGLKNVSFQLNEIRKNAIFKIGCLLQILHVKSLLNRVTRQTHNHFHLTLLGSVDIISKVSKESSNGIIECYGRVHRYLIRILDKFELKNPRDHYLNRGLRWKIWVLLEHIQLKNHFSKLIKN